MGPPPTHRTTADQLKSDFAGAVAQNGPDKHAYVQTRAAKQTANGGPSAGVRRGSGGVGIRHATDEESSHSGGSYHQDFNSV
jgi:hypothetical protein